MLKYCTICGKIHDINKVCKRKTTKKDTKENRFRHTSKWQKKSIEIRKRDGYLCQACLNNLKGTDRKYNYKELEVHHIVPVAEDFDKRLDNDNLITLCRSHHEMAEKGEIDKDTLREIVKKKNEEVL